MILSIHCICKSLSTNNDIHRRETSDENGPENDYEPFGHVLYLPYYMIDAVGKFWESTPVQYGDHTPLFSSLFSTALDDREDKLDMFGAKLPKENM